MSTLKYCLQCNNILYPKDDKENHELLYACENCDYQEASENSIIYKMEIRKSSKETGTGTGLPRTSTCIPKDVTADASLPRTRSVKCSNCNFPESVFFQCAGNRITAMSQHMKVRGVGWDISAIGNATWGGAKLSDILQLINVSTSSSVSTSAK